MTNLKLGETRSEAFKLISGGAAYTLQFSWQPDLVIVNNLTDWTATAAGTPRSFWFRDQTDAAAAYQQQVIDSNAAQSFNFLDTTTNGFTVADTDGGAPAYRSLISGVSQADPCVVTTAAVHGLQTNQIVRITDLTQEAPTPRGMPELNNLRFRVTVINTTSFSLRDPITDEAIDSTAFTAWVEGGRVDLETRVGALNNPQVSPYDVTPYSPTGFIYDPIDYRLTLGSNVVGGDGDLLLVEARGFGLVTDLGDIG